MYMLRVNELTGVTISTHDLGSEYTVKGTLFFGNDGVAHYLFTSTNVSPLVEGYITYFTLNFGTNSQTKFEI